MLSRRNFMLGIGGAAVVAPMGLAVNSKYFTKEYWARERAYWTNEWGPYSEKFIVDKGRANGINVNIILRRRDQYPEYYLDKDSGGLAKLDGSRFSDDFSATLAWEGWVNGQQYGQYYILVEETSQWPGHALWREHRTLLMNSARRAVRQIQRDAA